VGDRESNLKFGVDHLSSIGRVVRVSSVYETRPVGKTDQPDFLNAAAEFRSFISPENLLDMIKEIEIAAGRDLSAERWGPRPLDIDILLFGLRIIRTTRLIIPHPSLAERQFVLEPLAQIAPDAIVPGIGKTCGDLWTDWQKSQIPNSAPPGRRLSAASL